MRIKEVRIIKIGKDSFGFSVPKAYIKDGNIELSRRYNITLEPADEPDAEVLAIGKKTQEILIEQTRKANANKTDFI